ncbi:MAG: relaxase/mobilization nuclease domain-containing protein [Hydrococcus sp. RU_2_2]|nr:relaxase/mobilization nuclease domain-containing protein [Hydrococcus sp. RU_2_2]
MIAKTKANKSFRGTTKYVVEKAQASIIGGNMIGTETDQLVAQFMISKNLNPKVKEPCYHLMLSLPHSETLSNEQFASLGERHFATVVVLSQLTGEKAKLTNPDQRISEDELNSKVDKFLDDEIHQYSFFIARHNDSDHDHIHIVASRINEITTHAIKTWKQYPQSEWSARLLEKKFGLEQIPCSWESKTRAFTRSQRDRLEKDGLPGAEIMRLSIDEAAQDRPTMPVLIERLALRGIAAEVSYKNNGQVRGIRFSINVGEVDSMGNPKLLTITGGGLNRHKYSFPKLQSELGISYIPERDDKALRATVGNAQKLLTAFPTEKQQKDKEETAELKRTEQLVQNDLPLELTNSNLIEGEKSSQPINQPYSPPQTSPISPEPSSQLLNTPDGQSSQPSRTSSESNPLSRLSDTELLRYVRAVEQWQKNRPPEPRVELGESYQNRIEKLNRQKANLENRWRSEALELKQLGKPRSLLNPFGVKAEIIEEKQNSLLKTRANLNNIKLQLDQTQKDLTHWQQKARVYLAWSENPHTKK